MAWDEKTEFEKAVSQFSNHLNTRLVMHTDGTIEPSEPSFDVSGINDYIKMLIIREQDTVKRSFQMGEAEGYHKGRNSVPQPLYGDFAFTNGSQKFIIHARGDHVTASEFKDGNRWAMQEIPKSELSE